MEGRELPLRGHRDDATVATEDSNQGIDFLNHLMLKTSHMHNYICIYMSQNELLSCIGEYLLNELLLRCVLVIGPYFLADEVTDTSNWEQLVIVVRYVKETKIVERCHLLTVNQLHEKMYASKFLILIW